MVTFDRLHDAQFLVRGIRTCTEVEDEIVLANVNHELAPDVVTVFIPAEPRLASDTAFDPGLIEFLKPADLIAHETNPGPAHTPYEEIAKLPAELRCRIRLIHYPDSFDTTASTIQAGEEGGVLVV